MGYSREEIIFMTVKVPGIFNYSKEGLDQKIDVLRQNGLENEILSNPSYLMQGVELSYSRLCFFKDKKIVLDHRAFNYLVMASKDFEKRFGINNIEVKERYPFERK